MIRIFSRSEVAALLTPDAARVAVAEAHLRMAAGRTTVPVPLSAAVPGSDATFLGMAAADADLGIGIVKLLADVPANSARGLPTQRSVILVSSAVDGRPLALIDGAAVTRIRTAAASAVATDALARPDARVLGVIGAGGLALPHVDALRRVRAFDEVLVWNRTAGRADEFVSNLLGRGIIARRVAEPRDAVAAADVICTLTPSRTPILQGDWLRPGQHVNAVGARPRPDHREVDSAAIVRSRVFFDSRTAALKESGDIVIPLSEGLLNVADLGPELGEVLSGTATGRRSPDDITLFNSLGSGLQDLAMAHLLLSAADDVERAPQFIDLAC